MSHVNKKNAKIVAESIQLNEGAVEVITALAKKIPGINKYYQIAQSYKPQLLQILKTSKSGKEVKEKMEQLVAQHSASVAESYYDSAADSYKSQLKSARLTQLGGLAAMGGSILTTMWMNAIGLIDGVLARAAAGEMGGAISAGVYLGLIPTMYIVLGTMLMFKGASKGDDAKKNLADLNLKNAQSTQSKQPAQPSIGNSSIQQDRKKYETFVSSIPPNAVILKTKNVTKWDNWVKLVNSYHFNGQAVIKSGSKGKIAIGNSAVWGKWDFTAQNGQVNIKGKPLKTKNVGESRGNIGSQHEISWVDLGEDLSVEDKMRIVEEYALKGNLTESLDEDKKDYFISLFAMSDDPVLKNQYIVASLALVGNKIMNLGVYPKSKFLGKTNHIMLFNVNGEKKSFPTKTMRDLSMFNTFTFSTVDAYDKFKVALAMKFDASLPAIAAENIKESKNTMNNTKYVGLETKEGTWRVFKSGQAVAVAGPFKSAEEARAWIKSAEKEDQKKQGVTEAAGLYGPFTVTINTGERPKSRTKTKKFRREDDAILWAEDWLENAPQYVFATAEVTDPDGNVVWTTDESLNEQGVTEGSEPKLGTVRADLMHTEKPTVQVQVFKHNTLRGDSYWVTKEVKKFKTMDHAQAYIDRINKQNVTEGEKINELSPQTLASYKKKAGAAASEADKRGEFEKGHKRFKGIMKATKKEFEQDRKKVQENAENTSDKKTDAKIAALEKKIKDTQDAIGLARERRKMKGQRQQGSREMTLQKKINDLQQQMHMLTVSKKTAVNEDRYYDEAERTLADAKIAKENGDMGDYYTLMADYHDFMAQWNERKGRYGAADRDAEKAKEYHSAAIKYSSTSTVNEDGLIGNPRDKVTMDVPLMIRIMEYAREDAQSDMDLHDVAEQLIKLSAGGKTLTMQDYDLVVGQQTENKIFELGASNLPTAQTTKPTSPTTTTTQQTQGNTQPATTTTTSSTIKPAGATTSPTTGGAAKPGAANLKPEEQEALNKIMTNAGLKTQFQQLVQKSKTVPGA